jgi:electron transfer flavoprotein beta subunit
MHIVVPLKQSPDLVEEVEINAEGNDIDRDGVSLRLSEWDDQALEEALLLKDASGGNVTAVTLDGGEADSVLFTAVKKLDANLILTGVQSVEDLDGQIPVLLAAMLGWPHVSVVTGVELNGDTALVKQEYSAGVMAELEIKLPAVIGIQAARQAPRYVPVSKVRQIQKSAKLEEMAAAGVDGDAGIKIRRVFKPESTGHAEMIEGEAGEIAAKLVTILKDRGLGR